MMMMMMMILVVVMMLMIVMLMLVMVMVTVMVGLLQTVMAHGCHLTDEELEIFHETGSAISHCPNSNIS